MLVLGYYDYEDQGRRLAQALECSFEKIEVHHFPDGESKVRLPLSLPERVILCRSLDSPNSKLIELLLTAQTARELGVKQLGLVAPYLCYMRQDIAFQPGEAVSQRIIGQLLAELFDEVITTDAHLHRINRLDQAILGIRAVNTSAAPAMSDFIRRQSDDLLLVGPDSESEQWVKAIAENADRRSIVAQKQRLDDRHVRINLPPGDYAGRRIILVDDMISTGQTLITVADLLRRQGAASIDALITHALFDDETASQLREAGIGNIWSSDSITHPSNSLQLAGLLADAVGKSGDSVGDRDGG